MLRTKIDINGRQLCEIAIVNTGDKRDEDCETRYEVYDCTNVESGASVIEGEQLAEVWHYRPAGAAALIGKTMDAIGALPD